MIYSANSLSVLYSGLTFVFVQNSKTHVPDFKLWFLLASQQPVNRRLELLFFFLLLLLGQSCRNCKSTISRIDSLTWHWHLWYFLEAPVLIYAVKLSLATTGFFFAVWLKTQGHQNSSFSKTQPKFFKTQAFSAFKTQFFGKYVYTRCLRGLFI